SRNKRLSLAVKTALIGSWSGWGCVIWRKAQAMLPFAHFPHYQKHNPLQKGQSARYGIHAQGRGIKDHLFVPGMLGLVRLLLFWRKLLLCRVAVVFPG